MKEDVLNAFDSRAADYDEWFDRHPVIFQNELKALKKAIPGGGKGIEIGAGTGRFASAIGIPVGIEPSQSMANIAMTRGITVINAKAELLPFHSESFDYVVMVTTVCFLDDIPKAFREAYRIIKRKGRFIAAIIDKESKLGKQYEAEKETNPWYRDAHFHTVGEITGMLQASGFTSFEYWQTLFNNIEQKEEVLPGYGQGSFVVISAGKI